VKAKLVPIGNSCGVRLPKCMIEEADLGEEVDIHVHEGAIIITSIKSPRAGWAKSARLMHEREEDQLIDPQTDTEFGKAEWDW